MPRKGDCTPLGELLHRYISPEPNSGCWLWDGFVCSGGYGMFRHKEDGAARTKVAHRWVYELYRGAIPDGLELDHKCRVRLCCNPDHLEPVTRLENIQRGLKGRLRTHCIHGHPYNEENLSPSALRRGVRQCATCMRTPEAKAKQAEYDKKRYPIFKQRRQEAAAARRAGTDERRPRA